MQTETKQKTRLEELEHQFSWKGGEKVTPDTELAEGDVLRFEVDKGWSGTYTEQGPVLKLTTRSIIAQLHWRTPRESQTARISRDADTLRRRRVTRMGSDAEWEELKQLRKERVAQRREEELQVRAEEARLRQDRADRQAALELLGIEQPERLAELLKQVKTERETGGAQP